jgi:hypothetical protein
MPVRKLRSLQEAEDSLWQDPTEPGYWDRVRALWRLSARLAPRAYSPGVYRFRSIAELNEHTERWERERR